MNKSLYLICLLLTNVAIIAETAGPLVKATNLNENPARSCDLCSCNACSCTNSFCRPGCSTASCSTSCPPTCPASCVVGGTIIISDTGAILATTGSGFVVSGSAGSYTVVLITPSKSTIAPVVFGTAGTEPALVSTSNSSFSFTSLFPSTVNILSFLALVT